MHGPMSTHIQIASTGGRGGREGVYKRKGVIVPIIHEKLSFSVTSKKNTQIEFRKTFALQSSTTMYGYDRREQLDQGHRE